MAAQHVVNKVGRHRELAAVLALSGVAALDKAGEKAPDGSKLDVPYCTLDYTFNLQPA